MPGSQKEATVAILSDLTPALVTSYLKLNPQFLENYIVSSNITKETFQRWQSRRSLKCTNPRYVPKPSSPMPKASDEWASEFHAVKRKSLLDLSTDLENTGYRNILTHELMSACVQAIQADGGNLFLFDPVNEEIYFYESDSIGDFQPSRRFKPSSSGTISACAARTLESVRTADISKDGRFPDGIGFSGLPFQSVISQPIIDTSCVFLGVMELYRVKGNVPFSDKEQEQAAKIERISPDCYKVHLSRHHQYGHSHHEDHDRASLFLLDHKTNELYARIFDVGYGGNEAERLEQNNQKEIRFPLDRGIGGYVASTGQVLNIEDVYTDDRFNREIDLKTGYTTKTILCMPIFNRNNIIGIVQMVNKRVGYFTKSDEEAFETFAVYCGLALHYAKLYDKIRRSEQKYKVALEVLTYHSVCTKDEFNKLKSQQLPDKVEILEGFDVHPHSLSEIQKPLYAVYMFKDLFGLQKFNFDDLIRFVLTVRKNYRVVPYHNWTHGWTVAHAMYSILKQISTFTELEKLYMFVACLCHDLDHIGKTNASMKSMSTPLAGIYSTSVMEHHHFNQTVLILQQEGHNIFRSISSDDYKWVLGNIKHCILATDLALFFSNKSKLKKLFEDDAFSWEDASHRLIVQAVCMTGCDLIASAKPWEVQTETTKVIFVEFYEQGDLERLSGNEPIPMMDRQKSYELPNMQVGFMTGICIPCYEVLASVLPILQPLVDRVK